MGRHCIRSSPGRRSSRRSRRPGRRSCRRGRVIRIAQLDRPALGAARVLDDVVVHVRAAVVDDQDVAVAAVPAGRRARRRRRPAVEGPPPPPVPPAPVGCTFGVASQPPRARTRTRGRQRRRRRQERSDVGASWLHEEERGRRERGAFRSNGRRGGVRSEDSHQRARLYETARESTPRRAHPVLASASVASHPRAPHFFRKLFTRLSKSARAAAIVFSGPVILKNHGSPPEPSTIAASSAQFSRGFATCPRITMPV